MKFAEAKSATITAAIPLPSSPLGFYKVINRGLFFGYYQVVTTWTGARATIEEILPYGWSELVTPLDQLPEECR